MKLQPHLQTHIATISKYFVITFIALITIISLPIGLTLTIKHQQAQSSTDTSQFPVTVDPKDKTITENTEVDSYFEKAGTYSSEANAGGTTGVLFSLFQSAAILISKIPLYQNLASVAGISGQFVTITPGMRKEQITDTLAKLLSWDTMQKQEFTTASPGSILPLSEGSFFPGTYFVSDEMTPSDVQNVINQRFTENVLAHYGTSTAQIVPLDETITIASIIQRETIGNNDMRLISGIIWNRLFNGMNLQVDATLQYAKANLASTNQWWPTVTPNDKYIKSPYNTYLNNGLPPTAIANPSVAAIVAALNPIKTPCLYYFNDASGEFHCSATYAEHLALIKQYYGNN